MTNDNGLELLRGAVESHGSQTKVAKLLGYSAATISQVLGGSYQGGLDNFLAKVEEVFGSTTVQCPIRGKILLGKCVKERRQPFTMSNPVSVQTYRTCKKCPFNTERNDL